MSIRQSSLLLLLYIFSEAVISNSSTPVSPHVVTVTSHSAELQFSAYGNGGVDGVVEAYELSYRSLYDPQW